MVVGRIIVAATFVIAGLGLAGFFGLLVGMADCGAGCIATGERAAPLAIAGAGLGLVAAGLSLRRGAWVAASYGLMAAGLSGAAAIVWTMFAQGSRGQASWFLVATLSVASVGAIMLTRSAPSSPNSYSRPPRSPRREQP